MRIVRWSAQQRVDEPDLTQVSFQTLGEFRRHMRGVMLGPGSTGKHPNYIIRGFAVEPESPASSRVVVKIDPGSGQPLSFALGAENLGGGIIDHGQLMGGDDSAENVEGNAEVTLDFAGQPNATYTVEMRFVYSEGANDNRAFWNDAGNTEFIAATDTRFLPVIELRFSGSASAEWIPLAEVTWGGSTINAGNISDLREFAVEGAAPFTSATATGAGGVPDFDRSASRTTAGLNEVYPALRALARQIRDIKGPALGGDWSWFARPHAVLGATLGGELDPTQGYSLASNRTVHFTVGDAANTKDADFVGATALQDCLNHIETVAAAIASAGFYRVVVLIKAGTVHQVSSPISLSAPITLEIRGLAGGAASEDGARAVIAPTASWGISMTAGQLVLRNVHVAQATGTRTAALFDVLGPIDAADCYIGGETVPEDWLGALWAVQCDAAGSRFAEVDFAGVAVAAANRSGATNKPCVFDQVTFTDSVFSCSGDASPAAKLRFRDVVASQAGALHGENGTPAEAMFDLRGAQDCAIDGLAATYDKRQIACILGGAVGATHTIGLRIADVRFATTADGAPAVGAGAGGALGTGWAINVRDGFLIGNGPAAKVEIEGCRFGMAGLTDGGSIQLRDVQGFSIDRCTFEAACVAANTTTFRNVWISDSGNFYPDNQIDGTITACRFYTGQSGSLSSASFVHVYLDNAARVKLRDLSINGATAAGDAITGYDGASGGIVLDSLAGVVNDGCRDIEIDGCTFARWVLTGTDDGHAVRVLADDAEHVRIHGCRFYRVDGYAIDLLDAAVLRSVSILGCLWTVGVSNTERCARFASNALHLRWDHNTVQGTVGSARTIVAWGTQPGNGGFHSCIGNVGPSDTNANVVITSTGSATAAIAGMDSDLEWSKLNKGLNLDYTVIA